MNHDKHYFALTDLMAIITASGLLFALAMNPLAAAKSKAGGVACENNLKRHAEAFTMYLADYDDTYPLEHFAKSKKIINTAGSLKEGLWMIPALMMEQDTKDWYVPSFSAWTLNKTQICPDGQTVKIGANEMKGRDYLPNYYVQCPKNVIKQSALKQPVILLAEGKRGSNYFRPWVKGSDFPGEILGNHVGMANTLWSDGHVASYTAETIKDKASVNFSVKQ